MFSRKSPTTVNTSQEELSDRDVFYCQLNVDHGFEYIGFEDWERLGNVGTHMQKYLEKHDVTQNVS